MKNKILFIPSNIWTNWGGSEKMWVELALFSVQEQNNVAVLTKNWQHVPEQLNTLFKKVEVYFISNNEFFAKKVLHKLFSTNKQEKSFEYCINHFKPQLVIISQGANHDGLVWMEYCNKYNLPFITISQAAQETTWLSDDFADRLAVVLRKARLNLFVSEANKKLTEQQIAAFIPNGLIVANPYSVPFNNAPKLLKQGNDIFNIACVARFELHAKGQDVLIEMMSLEKWRRRDLVVNLYGDGMNKQHIVKLIKMYGVEDKVKMIGYKNPVEIWEHNEALILPSRYEGLPLALVEAMMCERVAIVTNVSGNAEVLINNVTGFIAAAPHVQYLDEAMERAWQKRNSWADMGKLAGIEIRKKISPSPTEALYEIISDSFAIK